MTPMACQNCGHQNPPDSKFCSECGTPLSGSTQLPTGKKLREKYIIKGVLGRGGFGRTYLAEDTGRFGEQVVVKELSPSLLGTYALQKAEELFHREAQTLYKLEHPQIPKFRETFQHERRLFLVQDFVEGQDYLSLVRQRSQGQYFREEEILQLFRQLLPVLSYIHRQGVIHRDISPDNILWRQSDGLPVLVDFGGVKEFTKNVAIQVSNLENPQTSNNELTSLVKSGYSPDEQLRGQVARNSDLYALAAFALCLMTGKERPTQELWDSQARKWIWEQQLTLSPKLAEALNRMLEYKPELRFQSADEVLQFLQGETEPMIAAPTVISGELPRLELLIAAAFTGFEGGLLIFPAIAVATFLGTVWISPVLWILMLGTLIFIQYRRIISNIFLPAIAFVTLMLIFFVPGLQAGNSILLIMLVTILAGVLPLAMATMIIIIYPKKLLVKKPNSR